MNWFRRIKKAMPLAELTCPTCHTPFYIDINQPQGALKSEPYKSKDSGDRVSMCSHCGQFLVVSYDFDEMRDTFATITGLQPITNEEAKEAIKTLLYVSSG